MFIKKHTHGLLIYNITSFPIIYYVWWWAFVHTVEKLVTVKVLWSFLGRHLRLAEPWTIFVMKKEEEIIVFYPRDYRYHILVVAVVTYIVTDWYYNQPF